MMTMEFEEKLPWKKIDAPLANNNNYDDNEGAIDNKDGWDDDDDDDDNIWSSRRKCHE